MVKISVSSYEDLLKIISESKKSYRRLIELARDIYSLTKEAEALEFGGQDLIKNIAESNERKKLFIPHLKSDFCDESDSKKLFTDNKDMYKKLIEPIAINA